MKKIKNWIKKGLIRVEDGEVLYKQEDGTYSTWYFGFNGDLEGVPQEILEELGSMKITEFEDIVRETASMESHSIIELQEIPEWLQRKKEEESLVFVSPGKYILERETEKAVMIRDLKNGWAVWLPKSQITYKKKNMKEVKR